MKGSFIKLVLALSLVINPVAVLAVDFHDLEIAANQAMQVIPGQTVEHDRTNCEMPCCEDSECIMTPDICIMQHGMDLVVQKMLRFNLSTGHYYWIDSIFAVPDRELPPDNPPPINI